MMTEEYLFEIPTEIQENISLDLIEQQATIQQRAAIQKQKQLTINVTLPFSNQSQQQASSLLEKEGSKKQLQNKLKYKKLKQKLISLSEQIQDQGILKDQKDITSPNKARLMKLALQFERAIKTQAFDYPFIESILKEIQKIVEYKRQHDILILRGARLMSTLLALIKRYPSLHKTQALQSMASMEQSLKLLKIMLSLSSSRQFLLVSNQLSAISTLLNCSLMRQQKKIAVYCLNLLNLILIGPIRIQLDELVKLNIEYMLCSSLLKRFKMFIQTCLAEDDPSHAEFLLLGFKFYYLIIKKACQKELERSIYDINFMGNLTRTIYNYFEHVVHLLASSVVELILQKQSENEQKYSVRDEELPNFKINTLLYIFKSFNIIFHVDVAHSQKHIQCSQQFINSVLFIFKYVKENFKQTQQIKNLCSEIIIFLGNLAFQNTHYQDLIRQKGILEQFCNHPFDYMMQPLKHIFIPAFCCIIHQNHKNFIKAFEQNSVLTLLQYIQKEISNRSDRKNEEQVNNDFGKDIYNKALSRKTSVSSINSKYSMAESFTTQTSIPLNTNTKEKRLEYKFGPSNWQQLALDLKKFDD